jgi:asparagine synthase (glutamine-hydrolysing)
MSKKIRHRGPDWSDIYSDDNVVLSHERLAIVEPQSGRQPLFSKDQNLVLAVNGEIYNHQALKQGFTDDEFLTNSDCEVIMDLYKEKGIKFIEDLNGIFAFMLYDKENKSYMVARDHMGIIPLYIGWDTEGNFYVAS